MRGKGIPIVLIVFLLLFCLFVRNWRPPGLLRLSVEGSEVKNSLGERMRLSGVCVHPAHSLTELWSGLSEEDVSWMRDKGFTACRLSLCWNEIEIEPGVYDLAYLESYVDRTVSLFEENGIYVILENHVTHGGPQWFWGWRGEGAPTFYTESYSSDLEGLTEFYLDFWANRDGGGLAREGLIRFWRMIAARYKGRNVIAGYELFNEPNVFPDSLEYVGTVAPQIMSFYNRELGPALREIDPGCILFYDAIYYELQDVPGSHKWNTQQQLSNVIWARSQYDKAWDYREDSSRSLEEHRAELKQVVQELYNHFIVSFRAPYMAMEIATPVSESKGLIWVEDLLSLWDECGGYSFHFNWYRYCALDPEWMLRDPDTGQDKPVVSILESFTGRRP